MNAPAELSPTVLAIWSAMPAAGCAWDVRVSWWTDLFAALRTAPSGTPYQPICDLIAWLRLHPGEGRRLGDCLIDTCAITECARTLTDAGMPIRPTLVGEFVRRLTAKLLPPVAEDRELEDLLSACWGDPATLIWLAGLPGGLLSELAEVMALAQRTAWPELRDDAIDAVAVLATRICAEGLSDEARRAIHGDREIQARFLLLADQGIAVARSLKPGGTPAAELSRMAKALSEAESAADAVTRRMAQHTVSSDLVYRMERLRSWIGRCRQLCDLLSAAAPDRAFHRAHAFLVHVCTARLANTSLRGLLRDHTRLLARRVVLHAAQTGSRYIAAGYAEWRIMLSAAIGGGFVMAVALHAKLGIGAIRWPAGLEWLLFGSNYATAFAWMYLAHWSLATKQPPVTAAALAQTIGTGHVPTMVGVVRRLMRTQLVSVAGNLLAVVTLAVASSMAWRLATDETMLSDEASRHILQAHDPLGSGVLLFAVETGFVLYLSGLVQGWIANQAQGRNLARSVARNHLLCRLLPLQRRQIWAGRIAAHAPGFGASVLLGFMLAALPVIGRFTGLPCDLRHVTISAGSVGMALASLPECLVQTSGIAAMVGVIAVGCLNILIGFTCALVTALRADGLPIASAVPFLAIVVRDAVRHPLAYLLPIGDPAEIRTRTPHP
jgi:site-specific recombinase